MVRLDPSQWTPQEAILDVSLLQYQNNVNYAVQAVLIYEYFLTLDQEVTQIWTLPFRLPKILFIINRYFTPALLILLWAALDLTNPTESFCTIFGFWQAIPLRLSILVVQAIVCVRIGAIYNNNRTMVRLLSALFFCEFAAIVTFVGLATAATIGTLAPDPLGCVVEARNSNAKMYASATWIAPVCFEFIMIIITIPKIRPNRRRGNPTLDILARDSIVYFTFMFGFSLTNAIIYELSFTAYYRSLLLGPTAAVSCIGVSRMMMNIRSLSDDRDRIDGITSLQLSSSHFHTHYDEEL